MARRDSHSSPKRFLIWVCGVFLGLLLAIVGIYVGATRLTVTLGCPEKTRVVACYLTVGLVTFLLVGCLAIYLKNVITATPPPPFTKVMAEKLCALAGETLPGMPNKKRSKAVLAVGLSIICIELGRVEFYLNYFGTRRFKPLRNELARETLYRPEELSHMATMAGLLHQDFMQFLQLAEPVVKFCSGFSTALELIDRAVLSNAAKNLEVNSNHLTDLVVQGRGFFDGHPHKVKFKQSETGTIKQRLDQFIGDLDQDIIKLDELRKPAIAAEKYFHSLLLDILPQ